MKRGSAEHISGFNGPYNHKKCVNFGRKGVKITKLPILCPNTASLYE